jgi:hypothetical protein
MRVTRLDSLVTLIGQQNLKQNYQPRHNIMNLIPRKFTSLQAAIEYATITKGIVYRFGTIFKVYVGNCPQPFGISAARSSPAIDDSTLIEWLSTL